MITRSVKFRRILDENIALRVRFVIIRGKVTAHGFAHQDILHPFDSAKKIELANRDYDEALTYAIQDLSENWDFYDQRYKTWLR